MAKMGQGSMVKLGQSKNHLHNYHAKGVNPDSGDIQSTGASAGKRLHPNAHVKNAKPNRSKKTGKSSRKIVISA